MKQGRLCRHGCCIADMFDAQGCVVDVGADIEVASFCNDSPVGNRGKVYGWRIYALQGVRLVVDYGLNAGGQRLLKTYPANVLRIVSPKEPK